MSNIRADALPVLLALKYLKSVTESINSKRLTGAIMGYESREKLEQPKRY